MFYVKWILRITILTLFAAFLHYTLPQHDIVRISDTYEKRVDVGVNSWFWTGGDAGSATGVVNRDVFFIQAFDVNGKPIVYRNEDTGWGWPPFFKFDTSNLQAEASDLITKDDTEATKWAVVRHYGWRNEFLTVFPNALSIRQASGPDEQIIPWGNILRLTLIAALFWAITVRWVRFRRARIDPIMDRIDDWFAARFGKSS